MNEMTQQQKKEILNRDFLSARERERERVKAPISKHFTESTHAYAYIHKQTWIEAEVCIFFEKKIALTWIEHQDEDDDNNEDYKAK